MALSIFTLYQAGYINLKKKKSDATKEFWLHLLRFGKQTFIHANYNRINSKAK